MYNFKNLSNILFSPIFPYLPFILGISLFLLSKYIDPSYFYLCDGDTIDQLKDSLAKEVVNYKEALIEFDDLMNNLKKAQRDNNDRMYYYYDLNSEIKADDLCDIIRKIQGIENNIKQIDASFESSSLDRRKYFENL
jgi:hypothetical protein